MASSCKKCKPSECEECPEWIFTFADLVMLMMGFFVILWVLKPNPGKKTEGDANDYLIQVEASIREGFGYEPNPRSNDEVDRKMISNRIARLKSTSVQDGGKVGTEPKGPDGSEPTVSNIRASRQATEGGKMLFERGNADLGPETEKALNQVADLVRGHRNIIMVKGHTSLDDLPDGATPQQKMDLSLRRAQTAAEYLISRGVDPRIVRVQGCSTFEPLTQRNYAPDSQNQNRRIEVEATATLADDLQGQPADRSGTPTGESSRPSSDK